MKILYITDDAEKTYPVETFVPTKIANVIKWLVGIGDDTDHFVKYKITYTANGSDNLTIPAHDAKFLMRHRSGFVFYSNNEPRMLRRGSSANLFQFLKIIDLMPPVFIQGDKVEMFMNDPSSGLYRLMETYYSISEEADTIIFAPFYLNKFHPAIRSHVVSFFKNINSGQKTVIFEGDQDSSGNFIFK